MLHQIFEEVLEKKYIYILRQPKIKCSIETDYTYPLYFTVKVNCWCNFYCSNASLIPKSPGG